MAVSELTPCSRGFRTAEGVRAGLRLPRASMARYQASAVLNETKKKGQAMRRVVVTGLGMVSPLANGVEETWTRLLDGQSGAGTISRFDAGHMATTYACEVPLGDGSNGTFNPDDVLVPKERRKVDDFILYGLAAVDEAVRDAALADHVRSMRKRRIGCAPA